MHRSMMPPKARVGKTSTKLPKLDARRKAPEIIQASSKSRTIHETVPKSECARIHEHGPQAENLAHTYPTIQERIKTKQSESKTNIVTSG